VLWVTQDLCAKKKPPAHPVNLNTATSEELQEVPGIGLSTARKIPAGAQVLRGVQKRGRPAGHQRHRAERLEKMRMYLTVGKPAPSNKAQKAQ
jgi:predicted DNA-binding helix-hairpin-helix protein